MHHQKWGTANLPVVPNICPIVCLRRLTPRLFLLLLGILQHALTVTTSNLSEKTDTSQATGGLLVNLPAHAEAPKVVALTSLMNRGVFDAKRVMPAHHKRCELALVKRPRLVDV